MHWNQCTLYLFSTAMANCYGMRFGTKTRINKVWQCMYVIAFSAQKVSPEQKKVRKPVHQSEVIDLTGEGEQQLSSESVDCPVYKRTDITINEAVRIFKGAVNIPEEKVCSRVPNLCGSRNATFAIRLSSTSLKDLPCDDHGKWTNKCSTSLYFDQIGTRKDSSRRKPDEYSLQVRQTTYENADAPEFRKKIYLAFGSNGASIGEFGLVAYHWICEPYEFVSSPHGNARKQSVQTPYQRTKPSVLTEMRDWP